MLSSGQLQTHSRIRKRGRWAVGGGATRVVQGRHEAGDLGLAVVVLARVLALVARHLPARDARHAHLLVHRITQSLLLRQ